jgi:hypothetical protein
VSQSYKTTGKIIVPVYFNIFIFYSKEEDQSFSTDHATGRRSVAQ